MTDRLVASLAAAGALGVAAIPYLRGCGTNCSFFGCLIKTNAGLSNGLHFSSAAVFFGMSAIMTLINFRRGNPNDPTNRWKYRVFRLCGWGIVVCLLLLAADHWRFGPAALLQVSRLTFWLESLAIWAFAIAWLTKGEFWRFSTRPAG